MQFEQKQTWGELTRWIIANEQASVIMELHPKKQRWGGTAWIYSLWTNEAARLHGYAKEVLERAETMATNAGHKSVFLEWKLKHTPKAVLEWYERRGYQKRIWTENEDYCLLEKQLKM